MIDTSIANVYALKEALEARGFIADVDGHTVAFVIEDYEDCSAPMTAQIINGGRAAHVNINGFYAGTQAYNTTDDLADALVSAYERGEL